MTDHFTENKSVSLADATSMPCPCGSGGNFNLCCAPLHLDSHLASTAEQLMRSRYSAYAVKNAEYLKKTHHPSTLDKHLETNLKDTFDHCAWTGLKITECTGGMPQDKTGTIRFEATFRQQGSDFLLKENSRFIQENGQWLYLDGEGGITPVKRMLPKRNEPCWCGSGQKFKKCHGK